MRKQLTDVPIIGLAAGEKMDKGEQLRWLAVPSTCSIRVRRELK